jgi:hypothetical protein
MNDDSQSQGNCKASVRALVQNCFRAGECWERARVSMQKWLFQGPRANAGWWAWASSLRVEYAGAYYHVMARGNRREEIFLDEKDRRFLIANPVK